MSRSNQLRQDVDGLPEGDGPTLVGEKRPPANAKGARWSETPDARHILLPHHLEDLRKSGLSDATIQSWGCYSIGEQDRTKLCGFAKGVSSPGLALPILPPGKCEPVGFAYKPDSPRVEKRSDKERKRKYEFPKGWVNHVHVPRGAQHLFLPQDGKEGPRRLVVTEGQKKAEKGVQEGIPCIALLGVNNWVSDFGGESVPLAELVEIDWSLFDVEICFDSDAASNPNVRRAENALARWLRSRGARSVSIVRLPPGKDNAKVGLDDYLLNSSADEFQNLPHIDSKESPLIDEVESLSKETTKKRRGEILARIWDEEKDASERERLLKIAAKRTGISFKSLNITARTASKYRSQDAALEDPDRADERRNSEIDAILNGAQRHVTLRGQNIVNGHLAYVCAFGEDKILIAKSPDVVGPASELPDGMTLTKPAPDRSPLSVEGVKRFQLGDTVDGVELFETLKTFFSRYAIYRHPSVASALALWTIGTYCYRIFNYYGYLWLTSAGPSHGKSLVEKMLSMLCFNASPPITVPTPAALFRDAEVNAGTLILDEVENVDPESKAEILAILNAGFEQGGEVRRLVPAGDGWKPGYFQVYCPKVLAGISSLPRTLHTRVFQIEMPRRKPTETIDLFQPDRLQEDTRKLRDDQAIFALKNAAAIADAYAGRDSFFRPDGPMEDRLRDILSPLYAVAAVIDRENGDTVVTRELDQFAALQAGKRLDDSSSDLFTILVHLLYNWAKPRWRGGKVVIKTIEALKLFNADNLGLDLPSVKRHLGKLGGVNKPAWWDGKPIRGYVFDQAELQDLWERYPLSET